ncbi:MAG: phage protein Gp27 family protein [Sphingobium sp.]
MPRKRERPSSIDRLLPSLQELIGRLRREGRTIDEIRSKLMELDVDVSRSALGRHVKSLADVQRRMRDSREIANALVSQFGDQPDNKLAQANIELMHSVVMQTLTHVEEDDDGNIKPLMLDPKEAMFLASALSSLSSAAKSTDDRLEKAEKRAAAKATQEAADRAVTAARAQGLSKDGVSAIRQAITTAVLGA